MITPHPRLKVNAAEKLAGSIVAAAHASSPNLVGANESRSPVGGEPFFNSLLGNWGWESSFLLPDEAIQRYAHKGFFTAEGGTVFYQEDHQFGFGGPSAATIAASEKRKTG
jgi:hypothetical protein